jgi:hypothetical protein
LPPTTKPPTPAPTTQPPTLAPTSAPTSTPRPTATAAPPLVTPAPTVAPPVVAQVAVQLRLAVTVATASAPAFQRRFERSVADALAINVSRVSVTGVIAGSAILVVAISPDESANATSTLPSGGSSSSSSSSSAAAAAASAAEMQQLAASLVSQAANPSSPLIAQVAAQTGAQVDTSFQPPPPVTLYTCWDGSSVHAPSACPSAPVPAAAAAAASPAEANGSSKPLGIYAGIGVALALVLGALVYCWYRSRRAQSYRQHHDGAAADADDGRHGDHGIEMHAHEHHAASVALDSLPATIGAPVDPSVRLVRRPVADSLALNPHELRGQFAGFQQQQQQQASHLPGVVAPNTQFLQTRSYQNFV